MPVLICYDGSESAKRSLTVAQQALNGDGAVLLHVWNPPDRIVADAFSGREDEGGPTYAQLEELSAQRAKEVLAEGEALAGELGLAVRPRAQRARSSVPETILEVADELDADLIVTGTHGGRAVVSGLLGSVSNSLVHNARRPVLVVPEHGAESR